MVLFFLALFSNTLAVGAAEKEERKWQDQTVYSLMIDRFNNGDQTNDTGVDINDPNGYHGGDFQGIIDQLDYIKEMGFTAISLTPIFANEDSGYHGYWVNDFYQTDERFGSNDLFNKLVDEAHKRDMKVILDFVSGYVGPNHPWVNDPTKKDWFREEQEEVNEESIPLPKLNHENPEVKQYLIDAAKWWIKESDIDGYLLDSVGEVPTSFWVDFTNEVKSVKKDFFLLGEVTTNDPVKMESYAETGIDGFVDFPLNEALRKVFPKPDQSFGELFKRPEQNEELGLNSYLMGTFMDNHHTVRFTRDMVENNEHPGPRWKQSLTYLYTTPGIPIVYYGSEIALDGGNSPDNRRQMNFRTDKELIDYMAKLSRVRSQLPSLTRGKLELLYEQDGMAVYKREYQEETSVVAINNTTETQTVAIPAEKFAESADNKELRGMLNGDLVRDKDKQYTITIDRDESEIYVLSEKSGINSIYLFSLGVVLLSFFVFIILVSKRSRRS
jgi:glycosidase